MNRITRLFCFPPLRLNNPAGNNKISMLLPMIGVISIAFSLGFAYALPLEDYSETPTKKSIDKILKFCADNANTTLTNETIMSLNLSQFYSDYTCDEAKQAKSLLKSDNPNANDSTTVTMIH